MLSLPVFQIVNEYSRERREFLVCLFFYCAFFAIFFVFKLSFIMAKMGLNPSLAFDFSRLCFLCQRSQIVNRYSLYSKDGFESLLIFFTCHPSLEQVAIKSVFFSSISTYSHKHLAKQPLTLQVFGIAA